MKPSTTSPSTKHSSSSSKNSSKSSSKLKKSHSSSSSSSSRSKSKKSSRSSDHTSPSKSSSGSKQSSSATNPHPTATTIISNHANITPSSSSHTKDKNYQKTFIGINAKSVKCMWEQHDATNTDVSADVLPILAEDASYKLWELANNLKTFTRHSGGKLTADIVNEVLKDCNAPPIIGARAGNSTWDRIDYDGTHYSHSDEIIDLRDEYQRDIKTILPGPLALECLWQSNTRYSKEMNRLWKSVVLGILMGDETTFQYAIHTTLINPFIGCVLPLLVHKCIEYLSFGCHDDTLDRILKFLKAIVHNMHSRDVTNSEEYFNLSNLLVCLLIGPSDVKRELELINNARLRKQEMESALLQAKLDEEREAAALYSEIISEAALKEANMYLSKMDVDEETPKAQPATNKNRFNFLQMKKNAAVNAPSSSSQAAAPETKEDVPTELRTINFDFEPAVKLDAHIFDLEFSDRHDFDDNYFSSCKKEDMQLISEDANLETIQSEENSTNGVTTAGQTVDPVSATVEDIYSPFETEMCESERLVEDICRVVGILASQWGCFEHEIVYLLIKRLEIFFHSVTEWSNGDFKQLHRFIQVLCALGDSAFRELTIYFEYMPVDAIPERILPYLNFGAIFIRGRKDYFFYEYMAAVCGDGLIPFTVYHASYIRKWIARRQAAKKKRKRKHNVIQIPTKIIITSRARNETSNNTKISIDEMFPNRTKQIDLSSSKAKRKIGIKLTTFSPTLVVDKSKTQQSDDQSTKCSPTEQMHPDKFSSRIVVCRRKLLKKLVFNNSLSRKNPFVDYRLLNL